MSFTYDPVNRASVQIDIPRLLVADTDSTHPIFQDEEILMAAKVDNVSFFASSTSSSGTVKSTVGSPSPRRVAAVLLDALAANKARLAAALEVLDIKINGKQAADALRAQAQYFRTVEAESGVFAIAEMVTDQFSYRERVWKSWLRSWGV